jgi:hypothetical protein
MVGNATLTIARSDRHEERNSQHRERTPATDLIQTLTVLVGDLAGKLLP